MELGLAKSVYEGWPSKTQVFKPNFAIPNSKLGLQNPYMRFGNPKPKFQNLSSPPQTRTRVAKSVYEVWPPQTRTWLGDIRIWGLTILSPSFQTPVRHPSSNLGLWNPYMRVGFPNLSFQTQVRYPILEFGSAKPVYKGWPTQTQVSKPKFADA